MPTRKPTLRIVSDLHFAEHTSRVRHLVSLEPLFEGVDHVVFNGDSLETRFVDVDPLLVERKSDFDAFAARHAGRLTILTGNHDPDIGDTHHLDLENGAVVVTHGDTLFPDLAPWGWEARYFRREQERLLAAEPAAVRDTFEARLRACKQAVMNLRDLSPRYPGPSTHPWERRLRFLLAIRRIDRILRAWRETPEASAALIERFRPEAQVIIAGHTHRPGVWKVRGRWVINTGSQVPPLGALAVDIIGPRLEVRRFRIRGNRACFGPVCARIDLEAPVGARASTRPPRTGAGGTTASVRGQKVRGLTPSGA